MPTFLPRYVLIVVLAAVAISAPGQVGQTQVSPGPGDPRLDDTEKSGPPDIRPRPPSGAPPGGEDVRDGETLSDTLSRTDGVLKPPEGIDPGIRVPAPEPNPGTTRVIPPPTGPDGTPSRPK